MTGNTVPSLQGILNLEKKIQIVLWIIFLLIELPLIKVDSIRAIEKI